MVGVEQADWCGRLFRGLTGYSKPTNVPIYRHRGEEDLKETDRVMREGSR